MPLALMKRVICITTPLLRDVLVRSVCLMRGVLREAEVFWRSLCPSQTRGGRRKQKKTTRIGGEAFLERLEYRTL